MIQPFSALDVASCCVLATTSPSSGCPLLSHFRFCIIVLEITLLFHLRATMCERINNYGTLRTSDPPYACGANDKRNGRFSIFVGYGLPRSQ